MGLNINLFMLQEGFRRESGFFLGDGRFAVQKLKIKNDFACHS